MEQYLNVKHYLYLITVYLPTSTGEDLLLSVIHKLCFALGGYITSSLRASVHYCEKHFNVRAVTYF